jgi:hypothetical protein
MNRTLEPTVLALASLISGGRVLADVSAMPSTQTDWPPEASVTPSHRQNTTRRKDAPATGALN